MQDKIFEFCEKKLPKYSVVTSIVLCAIIRFNLSWFAIYDSLLSNATTVVSILIGILMSMMGFLLTVSGRNIVKQIVNMGVHKMILSYFIKPITCGLIIVVSSIIIRGLFEFTIKDSNKYQLINFILSSVLMTLCIYFLTAFIRIISLMYLILLSAFNEVNEKFNCPYFNEEKVNIINVNEEAGKESEFDFDNPDEYL